MTASDISLYVWSDGLDCRGHKKIGRTPAHTSAATELIATKLSAGSARRIFTEAIQGRAWRVDRMNDGSGPEKAPDAEFAVVVPGEGVSVVDTPQ
jgi:hypothetical protein